MLLLHRRSAESALSAEFIPGEAPLLGPEASSDSNLLEAIGLGAEEYSCILVTKANNVLEQWWPCCG